MHNARHIGQADIPRWTSAALDLFRPLAEETAARLGYSYPHELEEKVMRHVRALAQESDAGRAET